MKKRPALAGLFFALALAAPSVVFAQKVPIVALILPFAPSEALDSITIKPFREEMRALGYTEGRNLTIEMRHSPQPGDVRAIAEDVVNRKVDVIVSGASDITRTTQELTKTIPIVMAVSAVPERRLVASLGRPGGNTTGLSTVLPEMGVKRLELLRELLPGATRFAVLRPPVDPAMLGNAQWEAAESAAHRLGIQLHGFDVSGPNAPLEQIFDVALKERADGLLTLASPFIAQQRTRIAQLAIKHRLPTIFFEREAVDAGGLMSYGASISGMFKGAAHYVDKILKGAKPGDLPVEEVNTFEFVVNHETARAIGIKFPNSLLLRANP